MKVVGKIIYIFNNFLPPGLHLTLELGRLIDIDEKALGKSVVWRAFWN